MGISGSSDQNLKLWDLESGKELKSLSGYVGSLHAVAADFELQLAVCGGYDRKSCGFRDDAPSDGRVLDLQTGKVLQTLTGHTGALKSLAADFQKEVVVSGSDDGTVKLWKLNVKRSR